MSISKNFTDDKYTFLDLGLCEEMVEATKELKWKNPTSIQSLAIPHGLSGKDIYGAAETGSGKTGAFLLPIIHHLLDKPEKEQFFFGLIFAPTRELCIQIVDVANKLGKAIGLKVFAIIGGVDETQQIRALKKKPHIIVATPGRFLQILRDSPDTIIVKNFKQLVFDEADEMFRKGTKLEDIEKILKVIPNKRQTYLFSATMPGEIEELIQLSMSDPIKLSLTEENKVAKTITEYYAHAKTNLKEVTLYYLLKTLNKKALVFVNSSRRAHVFAKMLNDLNIKTTYFHGQLDQRKRENAVKSFRDGKFKVLVATSVSARGIDLPNVDLVINYDLPVDNPREYVHRVGRAGRAGRPGMSIALVTTNDLIDLTIVEKYLGTKISKEYRLDIDTIDSLTYDATLALKAGNDSYRDLKKDERKQHNKKQKQK